MELEDHLIIFIKNPEKGRVKTRIAATVGANRALEIYEQLLATTKIISSGVPCQKHLYYSDFIDENDSWPKVSFFKHSQMGGNLGDRMRNAFMEIFEWHSLKKKKVLIIGSDCPEIDSSVIENAFYKLDKNDFVIGPTFDGGYYLLGMKEFRPQVFENVAWSTDSVLKSTLSIISSLSLTYELLPAITDIDTFADWEAYIARKSQK